MTARLYFEVISPLSNGAQELPARLTFADEAGSSMVCETSRRWGGLARWRAAEPAHEPELFRHAFMKLCFQHLKARQILGLSIDTATDDSRFMRPKRRVRFATSSGVIVEYVTLSQFSPYSYPCQVNLYVDEGTGHTRHSWFALTDAQRIQYLPVMQEAVLTLWRSELQMRKNFGLQDSTPFKDLGAALTKARERLEQANSELSISETVFELACDDPFKQGAA
jgi:hypothetical protein